MSLVLLREIGKFRLLQLAMCLRTIQCLHRAQQRVLSSDHTKVANWSKYDFERLPVMYSAHCSAVLQTVKF